MTCANFEIALCDYLDGTLAPAEKAAVEQHLSTCASCAELARDARAAMAFMERVADVEPPPELVTRMFAIPGLPEARASMRTGIRSWFRNLMQPMLQPRMVMGLSLTILFFGMMVRCAGIPERKLTAADLDPARVWAGAEDRVQRGWERPRLPRQMSGASRRRQKTRGNRAKEQRQESRGFYELPEPSRNTGRGFLPHMRQAALRRLQAVGARKRLL
jgi:anti-sigma factor RsiW